MRIRKYLHMPKSRPAWVILSSEDDPVPRDWRAPWIFTRLFRQRWQAELALEVFNAGGKLADYQRALKSEGPTLRERAGKPRAMQEIRPGGSEKH